MLRRKSLEHANESLSQWTKMILKPIHYSHLRRLFCTCVYEKVSMSVWRQDSVKWEREIIDVTPELTAGVQKSSWLAVLPLQSGDEQEAHHFSNGSGKPHFGQLLWAFLIVIIKIHQTTRTLGQAVWSLSGEVRQLQLSLEQEPEKTSITRNNVDERI